MDLVIRPVRDQFLEEVAFPVFEMGMVNARVALDRLLRVVADERTRLLLELMLERDVDGAFWNLEAEGWLETVYRLLFREWVQAEDGWRSPSEHPGYAGDWSDALHLALMLEDPRYPYWDEAEAQAVRESCQASPGEDLGLAGMMCGRWEPVPRFPPHEVLSTQPGRGIYKRGEVAIADWSYRSADTISFWSRQLATKLGRLLKREETRLRPLEVPESREILNYWMGRQPEPPVLAVAFSGLGPKAAGWVREIGELAQQIRSAAAHGQGMTIVIPQRVEPVDYVL